MRGIVWLDQTVKKNKMKDNKGDQVEEEAGEKEDLSLPPVMISSHTSKFSYMNRHGHRSANRISQIVSKTLRLGLEDVHWFLMGDDDEYGLVEASQNVLQRVNKDKLDDSAYKILTDYQTATVTLLALISAATGDEEDCSSDRILTKRELLENQMPALKGLVLSASQS